MLAIAEKDLLTSGVPTQQLSASAEHVEVVVTQSWGIRSSTNLTSGWRTTCTLMFARPSYRWRLYCYRPHRS